MTLLAVENLCVSYLVEGVAVPAVRGISFALGAGESLGIVGESASGKSSLAQAITRLTPSATLSGAVHFEGKDLLRLSDKQMRPVRGRRIGMVFQDPMSALNPTLSIGKQVVEPLLIHRLIRRFQAAEAARMLLEKVRLPDPERKRRAFPHQLSGGEKQRALIAQAIACRPSLLIADEPTTALDAPLQNGVLDLIAQMRREENMALILISHDLAAVSRVCDRLLVLYAGKIVEEGPTSQILAAPRHPYTQLLLRSRPTFATPKGAPLSPIQGSPPSPLSLPAGCPFEPRCPYAHARCSSPPPLINGSACWISHDPSH
jgi:oligopeptide/dipeptide ABC transporter ATP-binding protein